MKYDPEAVRPMRDELVRLGAEELVSPEDVDRVLGSSEGTTLLVINSICGCAAANARPAIAMSRGHETQPDRIVTVFAGQDVDATDRAREYIEGFRPSSPSIALFRQGRQVFMLERHQIEGREVTDIATELKGAYDRFCGAA
ncbi:MAG: BrxA/BrxB family bacilliredoxin [Candidatus Palauibacterales bacterium]|nr:BrxA/BrxB family bacilliredoxin [Candidatus Palauibacterales bacterium]